MAIVVILLGSLGREAVPTVVKHSDLWLSCVSFGRLTRHLPPCKMGK